MTASGTALKIQPARGLGWGTFLAGFVPGLLQWRLGRRASAVVALLSCSALYFAGWVLVDGRLFHFGLFSFEASAGGVPAMLASMGLPLTLPELLNLPAHVVGSLMSHTTGYEAERLWRLPRPGEDLGGFLTAASGMLAAFWSASAHFALRREREGTGEEPDPIVNPGFAAGVTWLLPGAGHVFAGQRGKGLLMGAAVLLVFAAGLVASHGNAADRATDPVWWIGDALCGGGVLFAALVTAPPAADGLATDPLLGTVLCAVAGLMNLVVMIDAYTVAERHTFPLRLPAAPATSGGHR